MTLKAYNGRIVMEWLADCLKDAAQNPSDPRTGTMWVALTFVLF